MAGSMMKDRRKRDVVSWSRFFWCTLFVVFSCVLFSFSTFRLFRDAFHPVLVPTWRIQAMEAVSGEPPPAVPPTTVRETVVFPDQAVIFLEYPRSTRLFTKEDLDCVFSYPNSSDAPTRFPPSTIDSGGEGVQIVRCPLVIRGAAVSLDLKSANGHLGRPGPTYRWDSLAYEALIDCDNTTVVFVKGLNLRPERAHDPTRFECVYGWDFSRSRLVLRSDVISVAQEIVRCRTPRSLLRPNHNNSIMVTVRVKGVGQGTLPSVARPKPLSELEPEPDPEPKPENVSISEPRGAKNHEMCMCTMVRNQARFLREWVTYHAWIGVQRWFIYDNNSEDDTGPVIESLEKDYGFNISRHLWPWVKTQEAGFAHCALRARATCEWVGFIDVDEFLHFPTGSLLHDILTNDTGSERVGEIRTSCYNFGPSGLKRAPPEGVTVGYTCRLGVQERHKSIVRPEALNRTLINVVHHFHLGNGFRFIDADRSVMVINHYKYQAWEVFKEKFYRRVATYVADWQEEENVGSKDRAPGLGTRPVEPPDWSTRFCEVTDTSLKDRVMDSFADPKTGLLPWQEQ